MSDAKRPNLVEELSRTAGQLLIDVGEKVNETARRANESEQIREALHRANETAGYLEERARELEPLARETASQAIVELQGASRLAKEWLRRKLEEDSLKTNKTPDSEDDD